MSPLGDFVVSGLEQQKVQTEELLESVKEIGQGFFLSTAWEIDDELPVELIHDTTSTVVG